MNKEIEIPEGYEARIEDNKVIIEQKENEDERIRRGLIHHLKELQEWKIGSMSPIKTKEHYEAWIAYLEKQKERKPADWSEEDESHLNYITCHLEYLRDYDKSYQGYEDKSILLRDIAWLKSLRSRPKISDNWKPSEEQMDTLQIAYKEMRNIEMRSTLLSLYNDLKKLM